MTRTIVFALTVTAFSGLMPVASLGGQKPVSPQPKPVAAPAPLVLTPDIAIEAETAIAEAQAAVAAVQPEIEAATRQAVLESQLKELTANTPMRMNFMFPGDWQDLGRRDGAEAQYRAGTSAIDRHEYEKAITEMEKVIAAKSSRADGACYWKAYAEMKLNRTSDALSTLAELRRSYPASSWLNDAKALEMEAQNHAGQHVSPDTTSDEDLKLLAINGLMNSDPSRATPMIEKLVTDPKNAPRLRERALFVLARSNSADARQMVTRLAQGGANPDLQMKAIRYLAATEGKDGSVDFSNIYRNAADAGVKRAALNALFLRKDTNGLLNVARTESNTDLRREAIHFLGACGATDSLVSLYGSESNADLKRSIINALFASRSAKQLVEIARRESDPQLKREAVEMLANMKDKDANAYLMELLSK